MTEIDTIYQIMDIRLAALHSKMAIVMGPSPPGTGVIAEETPKASS